MKKASLVLSLLGVSIWIAAVVEPPPKPTISVPCTVTEVVDGDTVTVQITMDARVRLKDCWAPEPNDHGGPEATEHLRSYSEGKRGLLKLDLNKDRLDKYFSFGRIVGDVYLEGERKSLSEVQIKEGHATREKP